MHRYAIVWLAAVVLLSGCAGSCSESAPAAAGTTPDGYKSAVRGDMRFEWKIDGANLHVRLSAKTTGWVAVGFDSTSAMKDANLIIGYVKDGRAVLRDDFGPDSDVDVIVEFRDDFEGKRIYNIYDELTALFGGRKIDLVEPEFLSPRMRRHILEHTEELYAA